MEWELDEAGNIKLPRLMQYSTALVGGVMLACQLRVAGSQAELEAGGTPLQLAMTASQAKIFALELLGQIEKLEGIPAGLTN